MIGHIDGDLPEARSVEAAGQLNRGQGVRRESDSAHICRSCVTIDLQLAGLDQYGLAGTIRQNQAQAPRRVAQSHNPNRVLVMRSHRNLGVPLQ